MMPQNVLHSLHTKLFSWTREKTLFVVLKREKERDKEREREREREREKREREIKKENKKIWV